MSNPKETKLADYFEYLDRLRDSGRTNMWGCGMFLESQFGLKRKEASRVAQLWMTSFDPDVSTAHRADMAGAL